MREPSFRMTAKFDSTCAECKDEIRKGDGIVYDPTERKAYCAVCGPDVLDKVDEEEDE